MSRARISTTVDQALLDEARAIVEGTDAAVVDAALAALIAERRREQTDRAYDTAYTECPIDAPDAWGDLASFRHAAAST